MSGDEIVFEDEVKKREPKRKRRPDKDKRYDCLRYQTPAAGDLPIYLDRKPADAIERHALSDTSVELGGVVLGWECVDEATGEPFVWITESLEAKHYENTQASFTYTHDSWRSINQEREEKFPDLDIVGWYHTHPDFGIFLSGHDLFIHRRFFDLPLQVAYVVDPIRQTRGFFQWRGGDLHALSGYYLSSERSERIALARLANDLENIPNKDSAVSSGFSPRLEAELINMLSHSRSPHAYSPAPQSHSNMAALYLLIGLTMGMIAMGLYSWISGIQKTISDNNKAIESLSKDVLTIREGDALVFEALSKVAPDAASAALNKTNQDLANDKKKLKIENEALKRQKELENEHSLGLLDTNKKLAADLAEVTKQKDKALEDNKQIEALRKDLSKLSKDYDAVAYKDDSTTGVYYTWYRYMLYTSIALAVICAWLGYIVVNRPLEQDSQRPSPPNPQPGSGSDGSSGVLKIT